MTFSVGDTVKVSTVEGQRIGTLISSGSVGDTVHVSMVNGQRVGNRITSPSVGDTVLVKTIGGRRYAIASGSSGLTAQMFGQRSCVLSTGEIIITGGYINIPTNTYAEYCQISNDAGRSWRNYSTPPGFGTRAFHCCVVLPSGELVLAGGSNGDGYARPTVYNDVWISSDKGVTWTQQTAAAGWAPRFWFSSVILSDGSILIMGGLYNYRGLYYGAAQDVWKSTNNGVTWTRISGPFPPT